MIRVRRYQQRPHDYLRPLGAIISVWRLEKARLVQARAPTGHGTILSAARGGREWTFKY